jgi:dUTP pyrophosphatase
MQLASNTVVLKIKADEGVQIPVYNYEGDAGADLRSNESLVIKAGERAIVGTGLYFDMPYGFEVQIRSRSGLAAKYGVFVLNSPGTIDCGYKNEIKVILQNLGKEDFVIKRGDRIAQMVVSPVCKIPFELTTVLSGSDRGLDGLGSTGVK